MKYAPLRPLVLILADERNPGGTLVSNCQEETLFRRTCLFAHLGLNKDTFYPIQDDDLIFVPSVGVIHTDISRTFLTDFTVKQKCDFIVLPCVKDYTRPSQRELYVKLRNKIRSIFQTAIQFEYKCVILGALGCGAFGCDSKSVATVFKEVANEYKNCGLLIVYSILGKSYDIFKRVLLEDNSRDK
jgi:uncharacterized protein (TIGR02452 family)